MGQSSSKKPNGYCEATHEADSPRSHTTRVAFTYHLALSTTFRWP